MTSLRRWCILSRWPTCYAINRKETSAGAVLNFVSDRFANLRRRLARLSDVSGYRWRNVDVTARTRIDDVYGLPMLQLLLNLRLRGFFYQESYFLAREGPREHQVKRDSKRCDVSYFTSTSAPGPGCQTNIGATKTTGVPRFVTKVKLKPGYTPGFGPDGRYF